MPRVAEVDDLLRRCSCHNTLEVAPQRHARGNADARRLGGGGAAITRAMFHRWRPTLGRHMLHNHQAHAGSEEPRGLAVGEVVRVTTRSANVADAEAVAVLVK